MARYLMVVMLVVCGGCAASRSIPFPYAETKAEKIANEVFRRGSMTETYWYSLSKQGEAKRYEMYVYDDYEFYHLEFLVFDDEGPSTTMMYRSFSFSWYKMKYPMPTSAAEAIAETARRGENGIITEAHFIHYSSADALRFAQIYEARDGLTWRPFTRKQRDNGIEGKGPVRELAYKAGKITKDPAWDETVITADDIRELHKEKLDRLAKLLSVD